MAEAGFYFIGSKSEPDLARCYVCFKELDGWEDNDNPWWVALSIDLNSNISASLIDCLCHRFEHKKHAPKCPFVGLDKKPVDLTVRDFLSLEVERAKRLVVSNLNIPILFYIVEISDFMLLNFDRCWSMRRKLNFWKNWRMKLSRLWIKVLAQGVNQLARSLPSLLLRDQAEKTEPELYF